MNSNSKKTLVVTSALCALLAVGGTVAYFTDRDDAVNKINIGQVKIDLTSLNGTLPRMTTEILSLMMRKTLFLPRKSQRTRW